MISRSEKFRLGVFLISAGTLVVAAFVVLVGFRIGEKTDSYTVRFEESVSGLEVGAQVKYNGVRVGQITDIRIDRERLDLVVARLELREGTPVKKDTTAVMVAMGITGLKFVELTGGSRAAERLPPGSEIRSGQSVIGTLEGKAQDIAVKMELALNKINTVLTEQNLQGIREIIANVSQLSGDLSKLVKENDERFVQIIENARVASGDLRNGAASAGRSADRIEEIIADAQPRVGSIMVNADEASDGFRRAARNLSRVDKILADIGSTLEGFNEQLQAAKVGEISTGASNTIQEAEAVLKSLRQLVDSSRNDISVSARSLRHTMRNLEELTADLRDQPSLLIKSKPPEVRNPRKELRK